MRVKSIEELHCAVHFAGILGPDAHGGAFLLRLFHIFLKPRHIMVRDMEMSGMPPEKPYNHKQPIPPELYDPARCAEPPGAALLLGIEQFNRREYFECHETLEAAWNAEPAPIRTLYKGILQIGVGCYHLLRHNYRGTVLKLRTGADYLEPFAPRCMGVEIGVLIAQARRLHDTLVALGPNHMGDIDLALLPIVQLVKFD